MKKNISTKCKKNFHVKCKKVLQKCEKLHRGKIICITY